MIHDPLCSHVVNRHPNDCFKCEIRGCECSLITKARADERERCIAEVEALGPLQQFTASRDEDGSPPARYESIDVAEALRNHQ